MTIQTGEGTPVIYYLCKDHLGSITGVMESDGDLVEEYNFDSWGKRRNPTNWSYANVPAATYTQHGFTGHEHLDMFNLINMNGRVYDSEIARFISPDPIIQDPDNIISYNRFTYCLNNPLKYTDPSGYSYRRFWELFLEEQRGSGQGAQFSNNYPVAWSAYIGSVMSGYSGGYGNFVTQYYNNMSSSQTTNNKGTNGFYITWETKYTYTNGSRQEVRDEKGNLAGVILPEVGVGVERHSLFVPSGGGDGHVQPDGNVYSFSFDFAFAGGFGAEIGLVRDKSGNKKWFFLII